jgi:diacylglycerol kinase (ATP)
MKPHKPFSPKGRARSFVYAWRGFAHVVKTQHNMWLHLLVAVAVIALGFGLHVSRADWLWLIASIAFVFFAEIMNSAFEFLCDVASKEFNPAVEKAKDIAAAAVLVAALGAVLIGLMVFWPYLT